MTTRNQLKDKGERFRHENELIGSDSNTAPGYQRMLSEAVYGGIWTRGEALCWKIASYAFCQHLRLKKMKANWGVI